jgi:hypothetical protein
VDSSHALVVDIENLKQVKEIISRNTRCKTWLDKDSE